MKIEACEECLHNLSKKAIEDSIEYYFSNREQYNSKDYFIYKNERYPVKNIIHEAIKKYSDIYNICPQIYNCPIELLKNKLEEVLGELEFLKKNENK